MHNHYVAYFFIFVVTLAILLVPAYLLSGLFGPRQAENLNLNAPEPTAAEFMAKE